MKLTLPDLYRSIDQNIQTLYVFPRIHRSSVWNPYLSLLYKDFLVTGNNSAGITCNSPHPLLPIFIVKKLLGEKSIVHYHWLDFSTITGFITLLWKMSLLLMYKAMGGNIVWTVHNMRPHTSAFPMLNNWFYQLMAATATRIHVHCKEAIHIMVPILQAKEEKFCVIEHPYYPVNIIEKDKAINHLRRNMCVTWDFSKPLFLMYGVIASYKGIIPVIKLSIKNNHQLIIAGRDLKGEGAYLNQIRSLVDDKRNITLLHNFFSKEDEKYLFNAVNCVVFNYTETISSGSVILARCYKKDILIPDIGCLKEINGNGVYKFNSLDELEKQLIDYSQSSEKTSI